MTVDVSRVRCMECGAENPADSTFCGKCGTRLIGNRKSSRPRDPIKQLIEGRERAILFSILAVFFTIIIISGCVILQDNRGEQSIQDSSDTQVSETDPPETQPPSTDLDNDGIVDYADSCYNPGCTIVDSTGCPKDSDSDGLSDCVDDCPYQSGKGADKGCPIQEKIIRIEICSVRYDAPGNDHYNLNEEWVKICNTGNQDVDMSEWRLYDESYRLGRAYDHVFYFPSGFKLGAGKSVTIYTGSGINTTSKLYWGRKEGERIGEGAIWTNDGDCAYLVNEQGNVVHKYCW